MAKSNRENEIKLAFPTPEAAVLKLRTAGAREVKARVFEDNVLFDFTDRRLTKSGRLLRLRLFDGAALLTFKAPVAEEHRHRMRIEYETLIAEPDAFRSILLGLGFEAVYRYQKYRATYQFEGVEATIDETPLGTFVELEGSPDDVDRAAAGLGATPSDFIRASYRELHEQDATARGVVAGDMLLDPSGRTGSAR
jgi:adenylate cyclase class 2